MRADHDVDLAFVDGAHDCLLFRGAAKARQRGDTNGKIAKALAERDEVLLHQNGCRRQHRHLLAAQHREQRGSQGDLGLAVAHVAAYQAIHGRFALHVGQHLADGAFLIRSFLESEALLELGEDDVGRGKGMSGQGLPLGIELQQLLRHLLGLCGNAPTLVGPRGPAQLVEACRFR